MATQGRNSKSPTIRRILKEAQELATSPSPDFYAAPTESDLFSWHFTIRGPPTSSYESGIYHGRIALPPTYPLRPPSFRFMTPSGRFEVNREICLSISGHHEETWMPAWGVRTAMLALRSFMEQPSEGQVGGMDMDDASRRKLADQSKKYICAECGKSNEDILRESAEAATKLDGEKKEEDKVPEELKMGYREDIEKKPRGGENENAEGSDAAAKMALADAALARTNHTRNRSATTLSAAESEDAEIRAAAARATLAQVGVDPQSVGGTSTPRAPTREDAEDIRMAAMFPTVRRSPIPRAHQSPNQLEPMAGSPPPVYRRPLAAAAPCQGVPAPTGAPNSRTSFHEDAFPPYLDNPQPRHPNHSPLSLHEFGVEPEHDEPLPAPPAEPEASGVDTAHDTDTSLPPDLVQAQAGAAARHTMAQYFEALNANNARNRSNGQPQREADPDRHIRHVLVENGVEMGERNVDADIRAQLRRQEAQRERERNGSVVWIDRLIALLVTVLMLLVVRYVGIVVK